MSSPSRGRGLKLYILQPPGNVVHVVPLAGTWIEINSTEQWAKNEEVVPLAGTWIEIVFASQTAQDITVVPLAGTWIEMSLCLIILRPLLRRPPRGDVD